MLGFADLVTLCFDLILVVKLSTECNLIEIDFVQAVNINGPRSNFQTNSIQFFLKCFCEGLIVIL